MRNFEVYIGWNHVLDVFEIGAYWHRRDNPGQAEPIFARHVALYWIGLVCAEWPFGAEWQIDRLDSAAWTGRRRCLRWPLRAISWRADEPAEPVRRPGSCERLGRRLDSLLAAEGIAEDRPPSPWPEISDRDYIIGRALRDEEAFLREYQAEFTAQCVDEVAEIPPEAWRHPKPPGNADGAVLALRNMERAIAECELADDARLRRVPRWLPDPDDEAVNPWQDKRP